MTQSQFTPRALVLLESYPLLQVVIDTRFSVGGKLLFKAEIIAHCGFIGNGRKDVKACADYIHTNHIY